MVRITTAAILAAILGVLHVVGLPSCQKVTCAEKDQPCGKRNWTLTERCLPSLVCYGSTDYRRSDGECLAQASRGAGERCGSPSTGRNSILCKASLYCSTAYLCTERVAQGSPCTDTEECAGPDVYCSGKLGTCTRISVLGGKCIANDTGACGYDFVCDPVGEVCVGAATRDDTPCSAKLTGCGVGAQCNTTGSDSRNWRCVSVPVVGDGADCTTNVSVLGPQCDMRLGLFCSGGKCVKSHTVPDGGQCQITKQCKLGATCFGGICGRVDQGETCRSPFKLPDIVSTALCRPGLVCSSGTGKCTAQTTATNIGLPCNTHEECGGGGFCGCNQWTGTNVCYQTPAASQAFYDQVKPYLACEERRKENDLVIDLCEVEYSQALTPNLAPFLYSCENSVVERSSTPDPTSKHESLRPSDPSAAVRVTTGIGLALLAAHVVL